MLLCQTMFVRAVVRFIGRGTNLDRNTPVLEISRNGTTLDRYKTLCSSYTYIYIYIYKMHYDKNSYIDMVTDYL